MDAESVLAEIVDEMVSKHGCHTVVLYGSRAAGDGARFDETSDYDVLGVRASGAKLRDARRFACGAGAVFLDAVIHPESDLEPLAGEFIRLRHGKVLAQPRKPNEKAGYGDRLIARAQDLFAAGAKPLEASEIELIRTWVTKMIGRLSRGGGTDLDEVVANYRRVWLLTQALEDYFKLRGLWYLGPKESLAWLQINDPAAFALFKGALEPNASRGALRRLADQVLTGS